MNDIDMAEEYLRIIQKIAEDERWCEPGDYVNSHPALVAVYKLKKGYDALAKSRNELQEIVDSLTAEVRDSRARDATVRRNCIPETDTPLTPPCQADPRYRCEAIARANDNISSLIAHLKVAKAQRDLAEANYKSEHIRTLTCLRWKEQMEKHMREYGHPASEIGIPEIAGETPRDEAEIADLLLKRLFAGRKGYGEWKVDEDPRVFEQEALEEVVDALMYVAAKLVKSKRGKL